MEWSQATQDIYDRAAEKLDELVILDGPHGYDPMSFGPGHIVWEDGNVESAEWCLDHFDDPRKYATPYSEKELAIVRESLEQLAAIPLKDR